MKPITYICLALVALLCACGDTQDLYSRVYCRLFFDNSTHQDATLATAMTPHSGVFVTVSVSRNQFIFKSNQSQSTASKMTALDQQRGYVLGMNGGIIVGYGSSIEATLFAYDRECPNCYSIDNPSRSYPVAVDHFGTGSCSNCHREYDLNNGGIVSKGDAGLKLTRYRATTTGPYGKLNVQ